MAPLTRSNFGAPNSSLSNSMGRLRAMQSISGAAKALQLADRHEGADLVDVHARVTSSGKLIEYR